METNVLELSEAIHSKPMVSIGIATASKAVVSMAIVSIEDLELVPPVGHHEPLELRAVKVRRVGEVHQEAVRRG